jgi:Cupin
MDALSEALASVRMTGAIFYHAECTAPWGFRVPLLENVAHVLAPGTERLVSYHLVTHGKAVVCFPGEEDIPVVAGDILIIPHGDAHTVSNGSPSAFIDSGASLGSFLAGDLTTMQLGGGGELTQFVCGYFGCERHADRLFLAGLPLMIKINLRGDPAGEWLESSVRHLVSQAGSAPPGQSVLLSKMAEALFIETIRRYMEALPPEQTGWLAGARDPVVGVAAPKTLPSLDRGAACRRERRFALGPCREVFAVSWRAAADLSCALAIATRRQDAANHAGGGDPGGLRGRLRVGSGVQPGVQARVRRSARRIQGPIQAIVRPIGSGWR